MVRSADTPISWPTLFGLPVDDLHAVRQQEFERRHAVVGKGADDFAVVVAIGREAVGLDHRPVGQILEEQIGRILDAVFLLVAGAAAERQIAAGGDGVAADVVFRLDHDNRRAGFTGHDGGRKARRARADHHNIGLAIPSDWTAHFIDPARFHSAGAETNSIADFV